MDTVTYYEIEVAVNHRVECIPEFFISRMDKIQEATVECVAKRGDTVALVKCIAPVRMQIGPITGSMQVIQYQEAQRTTIRKWIVTRARDMQLREA